MIIIDFQMMFVSDYSLAKPRRLVDEWFFLAFEFGDILKKKHYIG